MVFFLGYEVRPAANVGADAQGIGGAFVRAWLVAPSLPDARRRAQQHLAASGWTILTTFLSIVQDPQVLKSMPFSKHQTSTRRPIEDFRASWLSDGLMISSTPSRKAKRGTECSPRFSRCRW